MHAHDSLMVKHRILHQLISISVENWHICLRINPGDASRCDKWLATLIHHRLVVWAHHRRASVINYL